MDKKEQIDFAYSTQEIAVGMVMLPNDARNLEKMDSAYWFRHADPDRLIASLGTGRKSDRVGNLLRLDQRSFEGVVTLVAVSHPVLEELGIEDREIRAYMYTYAETVITANKLALAGMALGIRINDADSRGIFGLLHPDDIREVLEGEVSELEKIQQKLIQSTSVSRSAEIA